jgi:hypothetical protein
MNGPGWWHIVASNRINVHVETIPPTDYAPMIVWYTCVPTPASYLVVQQAWYLSTSITIEREENA